MSRPFHIARALTAAVALLVAALPARAAAQSLFAQQGLGVVSEPESARATGLGGVNLGLPGLEISWANPAGSVGLPAAGLLVAGQLSGFNARFDDREATGTNTRFPLVLAAFPFGEKWAVTAGFGSFLDQRWAIEDPDTMIIGGDTLGITDRVSSSGGVSRLRVAGGYRIAPHLSLGLGMDLYTGGTERVIGRAFAGENVRCCTSRWSYAGTGAVASLDWAPSPALRLSLSGTSGGTLKARPRDGTDETLARSYDLPTMVAAGASGRVSQNTLLAVSGEWAGWSTLDSELAAAGGARDQWSAHAGLEWGALSIMGRPLPLRIGGRYEELPFRAESASADTPFNSERAFSLGAGIILGGGGARTDLAFERGNRGDLAQGLEESFWRLNFSVSVLGQ